MRIITKILVCFFLIYGSMLYGQMESYNYKRELFGIKEQWHHITLPSTIYSKTVTDLSDIRIFGIDGNKDTLEVPYLLSLAKEKITIENIDFNIINSSTNTNGSYFTFEITEDETINQINLDFNHKNFDWKVKLEGSQNQLEWFTILDNYRILSIENKSTKFQFTKLVFPDSNYRYFKLHILNKNQPELTSANIFRETLTEGIYKPYSFLRKNKLDNSLKQSIIELDLKLTVPVNYVELIIKDSFDYYRPITIKYLSDSTETEQGWKYHYKTLFSGTLNSLEKNEFKSKSIICQKLQIVIDNGDNQPLNLDSIEIKGHEHKLIGRFNKPASYYMVYGKDYGNKPYYDLAHFKDKIPDSLISLNLGEEQKIEQKEPIIKEPLFKNKNLLWGLILLIIVSLGWFSLKMMKKN